MKPVHLPASAALALPRWGLFLLGLLYILPGLIGRDPWKTHDDAANFGIMWTMAHGGPQDWLLPHIVGLPMPEKGPLAFWLGALCIKLFGWLIGDVLAARLASAGFFLIGALSVWHTACLLGQRKEAQPVKLAFGGEPKSLDFGRMLADGALLIYMGCFGLLLYSHETGAEALYVALVAYLMYACTRYIETPNVNATAQIGLVLGCMAITRGWMVPLGLWLALFVTFSWLKVDTRRFVLHLSLAFALALMVMLLWLGVAYWIRPFNSTPYTNWMIWNYGSIHIPTLASAKYFFRDGIWFFWPAWPFAAWAVYAWRRQNKALHIVLPMVFITTLSLLVLINPNPGQSTLLPLLPSFAILAAFGLPTMKRGAINAIDWFAVMTLTTCAAFIWLGWAAMQTGWPAKLAKNAFKLAPGFTPEFSFIPIAIAACATAAWIVLVHWRISRRPSVLWRAVVLSSGGVILCWLLLMTLWLPWGNYRMSYAGVAQQLAHALPATSSCVETNVGPAQRASFAYFGRIPFKDFSQRDCEFFLLQDDVRTKGKDTKPVKGFKDMHWKLLWEGRRPADRDERFRLYRRESRQ